PGRERLGVVTDVVVGLVVRPLVILGPRRGTGHRRTRSVRPPRGVDAVAGQYVDVRHDAAAVMLRGALHGERELAERLSAGWADHRRGAGGLRPQWRVVHVVEPGRSLRLHDEQPVRAVPQ